MPHNSGEWDNQGLFQEFTFFRVGLTLLSLNHSWFSGIANWLIPISFLCLFCFQLGGHVSLAKRLNWKCWGLWEKSPISFASSCLKQECDIRSCGSLSVIVRKRPRESQRYQPRTQASLSYQTDIANYWTPPSHHVKNIASICLIQCWSGPLLLEAKSIPNWYIWQKLIPAVFELTLDFKFYLAKITSNPVGEHWLPWELEENIK